jgi:competence protein ComEA
LEQLPSIGPKTAARIVALRRAQGPFERLEQLRQVKGIGAQTLKKLRPLLKLE